MFEIEETPLVRLDLRGLVDRPGADFSRDMASSYFEDGGIDVSLIWLDAALYEKTMAQHRAPPPAVEVRRLDPHGPGHRILYAKRLKVALGEELVEGCEVTLQHLFPADAGATWGMLTIWRADQQSVETLAARLDAPEARWTLLPPGRGHLGDIVIEEGAERLEIRACTVRPLEAAWGRVTPASAVLKRPWQIHLDGVPDPLEVDPGGDTLPEEAATMASHLAAWEGTFGAFQAHLAEAKAAFRRAVEESLSPEDQPPEEIRLFDAALSEDAQSLRLSLEARDAEGFTTDGGLTLTAAGQLKDLELWG